MIQTIAVWEKVAARPSRIACATVPRMATMQAAIIVLEWPGSRPCSAPRRIALGAKSHALPVPTLRISVTLDIWAWRLFARLIRRLLADHQETLPRRSPFFRPEARTLIPSGEARASRMRPIVQARLRPLAKPRERSRVVTCPKGPAALR